MNNFRSLTVMRMMHLIHVLNVSIDSTMKIINVNLSMYFVRLMMILPIFVLAAIPLLDWKMEDVYNDLLKYILLFVTINNTIFLSNQIQISFSSNIYQKLYSIRSIRIECTFKKYLQMKPM